MRRAVVALAIFFSFVGEGVADEYRVTQIRAALTESLGLPCQGEHIWIRRGGGIDGAAGTARWLFAANGQPTNCSLHLARGHYSDPDFCTVLAHEWLHLLQYRPPAQYVIPGDEYHSENPRSLMNPGYEETWPPCKNWTSLNWRIFV